MAIVNLFSANLPFGGGKEGVEVGVEVQDSLPVPWVMGPLAWIRVGMMAWEPGKAGLLG